MTRLEAIKDKVPKEHMDVYKNTVAYVQMIDDLVQSHRELVASQAMAGISPDGKEEKIFYDCWAEARDRAITILEKELEDWQHAGDKNYVKNFK